MQYDIVKTKDRPNIITRICSYITGMILIITGALFALTIVGIPLTIILVGLGCSLTKKAAGETKYTLFIDEKKTRA